MGLRLRGDDCAIQVLGPVGLEQALAKWKSFEFNFLAQILEEEYVGEDAPDFDDVSNGVEFKGECHPNDPAIFNFIERVEERRTRKTAATTKFTVQGVVVFPDAGRRRIVVPNVFFETIPVRIGTRKEYLTTTISGKAKRAAFKK